MTGEEEKLKEDIELGWSAEDFLNTPIGKKIVERSNSEVDSAVVDFKTVDVSDTEAVRKIQNRMLIAEKGLEWLMQMIVTGQHSQAQIGDMGE